MFGRRRRGYGGGGIGLFLLAMQLHNFLSRNNRFFPVLMGVLALNVVVYLRPDILQWPSVHNACISASKVWLGKKWQPLLYSAFTHANDYHLYYNMASFMWKAATLEQHFGSAYFLYMTSVFTALTGVIYVGIKMLLVEVLNDWSYMSTCAVGFSGVVFALKVVTTHLLPPGNSYIMGIPVPSRLACWAELVLISVITPNASFVGHLAGIFVGLAFVWGPLKFAMDAPLQLLGFFAPRDVPGGGGRRGENSLTLHVIVQSMKLDQNMAGSCLIIFYWHFQFFLLPCSDFEM